MESVIVPTWETPDEEKDLAMLALEIGGEWVVEPPRDIERVRCRSWIESRAFRAKVVDAKRQHWNALLIRFVFPHERGFEVTWSSAVQYGHSEDTFWYRHGWGYAATAAQAFEDAKPGALEERDKSDRWKALLRRQRYTGDALTPEKRLEEERAARREAARVHKEPRTTPDIEQLALFGGPR